MSKENSNLFRALPHFVALMVAAGAAFGQVYRWVDEKGATHYGAQPPQGAKAREVEDKLATPPGANPPPSEDWQDKERQFRRRQIEAGEAQQKKDQQAQRRREVCNEQRDLLARLRQSSRVYRLNEQGERVYQDDSERERTVARQEKLVAQYCQE
jgi:uncharacterized protein DUF4124